MQTTVVFHDVDQLGLDLFQSFGRLDSDVQLFRNEFQFQVQVCVVVIGPGTLERLAQLHPSDLWRRAIAAALDNPNIVVIPVLLAGADIPPNLPRDLNPLAGAMPLDLNTSPVEFLDRFFSATNEISAIFNTMLHRNGCIDLQQRGDFERAHSLTYDLANEIYSVLDGDPARRLLEMVENRRSRLKEVLNQTRELLNTLHAIRDIFDRVRGWAQCISSEDQRRLGDAFQRAQKSLEELEAWLRRCLLQPRPPNHVPQRLIPDPRQPRATWNIVRTVFILCVTALGLALAYTLSNPSAPPPAASVPTAAPTRTPAPTVVTFTPTPPSSYGVGQPMYVSREGGAVMRNSASGAAGGVTTYSQGHCVEIFDPGIEWNPETNQPWLNVRDMLRSELSGWMEEAALVPAAESIGTTNQTSNIREGNSTLFPVLMQANSGDQLIVNGESASGDRWYQVTSGNTDGWIADFLLDLPDTVCPLPQIEPPLAPTLTSTPQPPTSTATPTPTSTATPTATPQQNRLTIVNSSNPASDICYVYLKVGYTSPWSGNFLDPGERIAAGDSRSWTLPPEFYDIHLDPCGAFYDEYTYGYDVNNSTEYVYDGPPDVELTFRNEDCWLVTEVRLRPASESGWGPNLVDGDGIRRGEEQTWDVQPGDYDIRIIHRAFELTDVTTEDRIDLTRDRTFPFDSGGFCDG